MKRWQWQIDNDKKCRFRRRKALQPTWRPWKLTSHTNLMHTSEAEGTSKLGCPWLYDSMLNLTCLFPPLVHWKQCTHGRMHLNHQWLISKHGICLAHVTARTHASASIIAVRHSEVNGDFRTPKIRGVRFKDKKIRNVDCETLTSDSIQNVGCRGHDKCYNMRQLEGCHVRRTRILLRTED